MRLAYSEAKMAIVKLIRSFRVSVGSKNQVSINIGYLISGRIISLISNRVSELLYKSMSFIMH